MTDYTRIVQETPPEELIDYTEQITVADDNDQAEELSFN